VEMI